MVYHIRLCWYTSTFSLVPQPHVLMHISYILLQLQLNLCFYTMWHWPSGKGCQESAVKKVTPGYRLDDPGFDSWKMQDMFSPTIHPGSVPACPQQTPSLWVLETPQGQGSCGMRLTTHHHLLPPLKLFVAICLIILCALMACRVTTFTTWKVPFQNLRL